MAIECKVGIIGGTGFETALQESMGSQGALQRVDTDNGAVDITVIDSQSGPIAFLPRHGIGHTVAPHLINHQANVAALKAVGVADIFSTTAVGSLQMEYAPGDIAICDDFIDLRGGAPTTFFERGKVVHTDFSEPFSHRLRGLLLDASVNTDLRQASPGVIIHSKATYLCLSGPRYETPAEVRCFGAWGAHIVGMTVAPEAILARELGIAYASVSVITNYGTGMTSEALSHSEVEAMMAQRRTFVTGLIVRAAQAALAP